MGNWISYNDSRLDIVNNPVTKNPYILFYKRRDSQNNDKIIDNIDNKDKNAINHNKTNVAKKWKRNNK